MLKKIISFSVNNKLYIILMTLGLILFGIYELKKLSIDAVPDITNTQIQIITVAPSLGTTDIERLITIPVEQANSNISGIKEIRSFSKFGLSLVTIVFNDDVDIYWARQQVNERLISIKETIPTNIGIPFMAPITTGLGEIYQYVVRAEKGYEDKYNLTELRTIQDWIVRKELLRVKGVAEVSSFGGKLKQYEVSINHNRLLSSNVNLSELIDAIEKNNSNSGGTYIEKNSKAYFIRTEGIINSKEDLENITIKFTNNGLPIKVKDVAIVNLGHAVRFGAMTYNGEGEVAGGVLMMVKGGNSSEVINLVKSKVDEIQQLLPKGVKIEAFLDRSKMVNNSIDTLKTNLLEGAVIVIFVLILFIGNLRAGLIVASVIPLSLLFAIILMNLFGVSGNLMSLGALDFGLIIDGAVIIVESILHKLTQSKIYKDVRNLTNEQLNNEVISSSSKMMNSAVFGQIIILIVYLPIFSLEGIEGKMFKPMAQTVAFALLGAFLLSLTYIPMMSSLFLSKKIQKKKNYSDRMVEILELKYMKLLKIAIKKPLSIIVGILMLFFTSVYVLFNMGGEFIPVLEEGDFAVEMRLLRGSNLNLSIENILKAEKILKDKFPEVIKVVGKTGSSEIPTDPMPLEASDLMVILKHKSEWVSAKTYNELAEKMNKELEVLPGISYGFQFPVQMRFNELMTGARQDVVCKIFGNNIDSLSYYSRKLGDLINTIDGTADLYIESVSGQPQIIINLNREAISLYNINIEEINQLINVSFAGHVVGSVYEEEKRFDITIKLDESIRNNIESLENLPIPLKDGKTILLKQLAQIDVVESYNQIQREDTKRRIIVGFNVRGRDVETIVNELQTKVDKSIILPPLYQIKYGGSFENLEAAKLRLAVALPIALVLIYLLLFIAFNSLSKSFLIYTAVPLSLIGGVFALYSRGMPFSISAGIGFIALFGVAVLNGIVLIAEFDKMEKSGMKNKLLIVLNGTRLRMRPVLMTAAVASLGFLPMAISNGAGADVQRPLATVVIGGLVVSTFLTLFILPILYINFDMFISIFKNNSKGNSKIKTSTSSRLKLSIFALLAFLLLNNVIKAQNITNSLNYNQALDSLLKNNLQLKSENNDIIYYEKIIDAYLDIPKTEINFEYGNLNSAYNDLKLNITQNIEFPTVYLNKKLLSMNDFESKKLEKDFVSNLLKLKLNDCFNNYCLVNNKVKLYDSLIVIIDKLSKINNERYAKGLINKIEKISIDNLLQKINNDYAILQNELKSHLSEFNLLINTKSNYYPETEKWVNDYTLSYVNTEEERNKVDSINKTTITQNTYIKILNSKLENESLQINLEESRLLPNLSLGLNSMSMRGVGADNKLYDNNLRFNSLALGFSLPVYWGYYSNKIEAIELKKTVINEQVNSEIKILNSKKEILSNKINDLMLLIFQNNNLIQSNIEITELSIISYQKGQMNYYELINILNQKIDLQFNYYQLIYQLNQAVYNLEFLNK